uniref:Uncharacterized protein n=1 Tax=Mastacembelus armatus TaxID=205130 RepID=A0A3Q3LKW9_9TELE
TFSSVAPLLPCDSALCSVFQVDLPEPKRGVLLELYVQTVLFCRERGFKREQTSALLSIIKSIHEANVETPLNNIQQCFKYCKELLLCHSVRRPPFSIKLFSSGEVKCIFEYIHNSYMNHYKLYKYIFTPQVRIRHKLFYTETQAAPKTDRSPEMQQSSTTEEEEATLSKIMAGLSGTVLKYFCSQMMICKCFVFLFFSDSTSDLQTLVEKEVR